MANILGIGIATLDIISTVEQYPAEDDEVRAQGQRVARGGNVTNTLVVLSQFGHKCSWGGVLSAGAGSSVIEDDLRRYAIDTSCCRIVRDGVMPVSCITVSSANASRTIVHYRDLPDFSFKDYCELDLSRFQWIHFEGRNVNETEQMLAYSSSSAALKLSLEVEKPRRDIEHLFKYAQVILFSKAYAKHRGYSDARLFLEDMRVLAPLAVLVCAWGEQGAYGLDLQSTHCFSPAFIPAETVDTIAAGDTFNAGIINGCIGGLGLQDTIEAACRLAGKKCGQVGIDELKIQ